jgi:hypothetical protein
MGLFSGGQNAGQIFSSDNLALVSYCERLAFLWILSLGVPCTSFSSVRPAVSGSQSLNFIEAETGPRAKKIINLAVVALILVLITFPCSIL